MTTSLRTAVPAVLLALTLLPACDASDPDGGGGGGVEVRVEPPAVTADPGGEVAFGAVVTGAADLRVTWTVEPAGCGDVAPSGLYTAPGAAATCQVRATSAADTTRSGVAVVTVATPNPPTDSTFRAQIVAQAGVTGSQRVNFGVPLARGALTDATRIRVATVAGAELATARRGLATWPDGSLRSVQVQVQVDLATTSALDVEVDVAPTAGALAAVPVADTLVAADGTSGPRVWVRLPADWLASSQVAGPVVPAAEVAGTALDAWSGLCDYARFDVEAFLAIQSTAGSWLFDRPTAMYLGYTITGSQDALESGYREAALYRAGISGTGSATRISVPGAADDAKYHYTQGMALHYLLTGDDRFREAAENVAVRMHDLWGSPGYAGGSDFWTERHAGFGLLAYEWALAVTDDRAATFAPWASEAVTAYLAMQEDSAHAWEPEARCFAHTADAHGEGYGYWGCSPWMSAILADGLDAYARRVGGTAATSARNGLVRLGRMIALHGLDGTGRPAYWMGAGVSTIEADPYDEHWGESAYVVAMAWHWGGRSDASLRTAALGLVDGLRTRGEAGQLRSFNWQCRSAPMTPYFLLP